MLVLNDVAWRIVQAQRGRHPEYVFVWRRERVEHLAQAPAMEWSAVDTINNTGFQKARTVAKLPQMRVHDLRHTYAQRLRDTGVAEEDRALLLGHAIQACPSTATAMIARLVDAANKVSETRDRTTILTNREFITTTNEREVRMKSLASRARQRGNEAITSLFMIAFFVTMAAAWFTHLYVCFNQARWGFLIAGALFFPIAIVHGIGLWVGFW